jgi:hypothetical protein
MDGSTCCAGRMCLPNNLTKDSYSCIFQSGRNTETVLLTSIIATNMATTVMEEPVSSSPGADEAALYEHCQGLCQHRCTIPTTKREATRVLETNNHLIVME